MIRLISWFGTISYYNKQDYSKFYGVDLDIFLLAKCINRLALLCVYDKSGSRKLHRVRIKMKKYIKQPNYSASSNTIII